MMPPDSGPEKRRPALDDLLFGVFLVALSLVVFASTRRLAVGTAAELTGSSQSVAVAVRIPDPSSTVVRSRRLHRARSWLTFGFRSPDIPW